MALNVTTAVFGENCNTATASPSLAQWDTEQVLQISGIDLPDSYKVEFSTVYTRNAIPVIGDASGVTIPNVLLQRSAPITAYVVLYGENGGRNREYWITIHITPGQPPETITPDPEQEDVIDQAIAALNNGVAKAEAAATAAEGSATAADGSAENAEAWAVGQRAGEDVPDTDPTYHNNSKYYAGIAEAAAEEAGQHEASWESWVQRAESAADDAEGSARAAAGSKADAEAAAQTATQKANAAASSATEAENSASEAAQTVAGGVGAINTARDGALTAIGRAGTTQTGAVNQAGADQVTAVNQAGATQVQAVEDKGDEVLDSIPQDYSELVDDVADLSHQLNDETTGLNTKAPVILETASGAIASFADGADGMPIKKLVAQIEPVQDLHGYDHPWPGGGGKNKLLLTLDIIKNLNRGGAWQNNVFTYGGYTITIQEENGYAVGVLVNGTSTSTVDFRLFESSSGFAADQDITVSGCPAGGSDQTYRLRCGLPGTGGYAGSDTGSGVTIVPGNCGIISIYIAGTANNLLFKPMVRLATETDAAFAPYSNICPISGWTGAEISGAGVNVWDEEWELGDISGTTGMPTSASNLIRSKNYIPIVGGLSYRFLRPAVNIYLYVYDAQHNFIPVGSTGYETMTSNAQVSQIPSKARYLKFVVGAAYGTTYNHDISINYPSTDTEHHPYTGAQISVTFPDEAGTVYGGTLTINPDRTGTLVVTHRSATLTGAETFTWTKYGEQTLYTGNTVLQGAKNTSAISGWCSAVGTLQNGDIDATLLDKTSATSPGIEFKKCLEYWGLPEVTGAALTAKLAEMNSIGNPFQIVYELNAYQTITLTAEQVSGILNTLYGTNNVWASTGDTEVEYPCDTRLFIERKIAEALGG